MEEAISDPIGLVEFIAKNLVKNPDDVRVTPITGPTSLVLELHLNSDDLGAVIGKNGRIARAIRTLLNSINLKSVVTENDENSNYSKIILEIIDQ